VLQVDTPQRLYHEPCDLFVAAFIGSPAMNLVEATVEHGTVRFARQAIALPGDRDLPDGPVIVGIRPESFEDAAFASPGLPTFEAEISVVEELGSDTHVFFPVAARPITAELLEAGAGDTSLLPGGETLFTARVDPRTAARVGGRIELAIDPARLHFFDPETGRRLVAATPEPELAGAR